MISISKTKFAVLGFVFAAVLLIPTNDVFAEKTASVLTEWGSKGSGDGQFKGSQFIALDSLNNVYVSDWENHRIQKFDSNGNFILKWGSQ